MRANHVFSNRLQPLLLLLILSGSVLVMSCQKESRGFVLPEGNIAAGKQMFSAMNCTDCHSVGDISWAGPGENDYPEVKLGGDVTSLKTYGELVTSVINPSHKISQKNLLTDQQLTTPAGMSKMSTRTYNEIMTVQQLVDIVAFLQSEYKLVMPTNPYPYK
jgi:sulfur-oxidizing protein SoxX